MRRLLSTVTQAAHENRALVDIALKSCAVVVGTAVIKVLWRTFFPSQASREIPATDLLSDTGTVVVTGANSGLGEEITYQLLCMGVERVVMACRNVEMGETVRQRLAVRVLNRLQREKDGDGHVSLEQVLDRMLVLRIDLTDMDSIVSFVDEFQKLQVPLDVLVENAGVIPSVRGQVQLYRDAMEKNQPGDLPRYESSFATNVLGHVLLMELLLPDLKKADCPRVVTLSSKMSYQLERLLSGGDAAVRSLSVKQMALLDAFVHSAPATTLSELYPAPMFVYGWSKRQNIWMMLARSKRYTGIRFNAAHPGFVDTPMQTKNWAPWYMKPVHWLMSKLFGVSVAEGARTPVFVCGQDVSGHYFEDCKITDDALNEDCKSMERANELYEFCLGELESYLPNRH